MQRLIEPLERVKFSTFPVSSAMTVSAEVSDIPGGGALFLPVLGAAGSASDVWRPAAPISDRSTSPSEWTGFEKSVLLKNYCITSNNTVISFTGL